MPARPAHQATKAGCTLSLAPFSKDLVTAKYALPFLTDDTLTPPVAAERAFDKDPSLYQKSDGWAETPQPVSDSTLVLPDDKQRSRVYAIDCEMVRSRLASIQPYLTQCSA